jgi:hypothetical protein
VIFPLTIIIGGNYSIYTLWGIPAAVLTKLNALTKKAEDLLFLVQGTGKTPANFAKCRAAFDELRAYMRLIKDSWFKKHVLRPEDYPNLLIKPPDTVRTPIMAPTSMAKSEVVLTLARRLTVVNTIVKAAGVDHGFRIYRGVVADDPEAQTVLTGKHYYLAKPPVSPEELTESEFTRKRRYTFEFAYEDTGKTAFFCVRIENEKGEQGPWGTMFSAAIP